MSQWYYLDDERQQVETDETTLRRLAASGELRPETLVWNDSWTAWAPLRRLLSGDPLTGVPSDETGTQIVPFQTPVNGNRGSGNIYSLAATLARKSAWTRALAVLSLVTGILTLPVIIGIVPLWMGIVLFQVVSQAEEAKRTGSEQALSRALEKAGSFFKLSAIFLLFILFTALIAGGVAAALGALAFLLSRDGSFAP